MSTRSYIGIQTESKKIKYVYCHFDGYLEGVGATLKKYYNTDARLKKLLKFGDISALGKKIGTKKDFDTGDLKEECLFYGRDRGETGTKARTITKEKYSKTDGMIAFLYLFKNGKRYYKHTGDSDFLPL